MTKAQIKAELRRSALFDRDPLADVSFNALVGVAKWKVYGDQQLALLTLKELRMLFLFVAEAL